MPRKILIVEDEVIVAIDLTLQLEDEGYSCIGPANTVDQALALIRDTPPDFAVLDANLHGATSAPIAERLRELNLPFVYVSGYGEQGVLEALPKAPLLPKPLQFDRLAALIRDTLADA